MKSVYYETSQVWRERRAAERKALRLALIRETVAGLVLGALGVSILVGLIVYEGYRKGLL